MSESTRILLGFQTAAYDDKGNLSNPERAGLPVYLKLGHTILAGMTQSGKTTTLEAIIHRSNLQAIAFKTKRGEAGFHHYREIPPYFKAGSGWQYVESLVNVALGEKVKYEPGMRGAIMRIARGGFKNLRELLTRAQELTEESKREFQRDLYMKLSEYLKLVVPELERRQFSEALELGEGVNIMDLSEMRLETQSLVISSVLDYAVRKLDHVIIVIPEAWEHIPQSRMTPVKLVAAQFIRKGAAIGNYLLIDSQDIAGIDKEPLRQCDNWVLGRQKDKREVDRTLEEIFRNRPSAEEIMTLPRGQFYACLGNEVYKLYVQPSWLDEDTARAVALGQINVDDVIKPEVKEDKDLVWKEKYEKIVKQVEEVRLQAGKQITDLLADKEKTKKEFEGVKAGWEKAYVKLNKELAEAENTIKELKERLQNFEAFGEALAKILPAPGQPSISELKKLYRSLGVENGTSGPSGITVVAEQPSISVKVERRALNLTEKDLQGKLAIVYSECALGEGWFSVSDIVKAFQSHAWKRDPRISTVLDEFTRWGYFEKKYAGKKPIYKIRVPPKTAEEKGLLKVES